MENGESGVAGRKGWLEAGAEGKEEREEQREREEAVILFLVYRCIRMKKEEGTPIGDSHTRYIHP